MSEIMQIILTASLTLLGGVALFMFGEFARVLVILPLKKYREQVQVTLDRLDFYANRITNYFPENPSDEEWSLIRQINADLRSAATQLSSKYAGIALRKLIIKLGFIPAPDNISEAYGSLMFLSNSIPREGRHINTERDLIIDNHKHLEKVKESLTT